jgi:hypothetical protein
MVAAARFESPGKARRAQFEAELGARQPAQPDKRYRVVTRSAVALRTLQREGELK